MEKDLKRINVVAAIIWKDNKFLIAQRPKEKKRGLLWEFVGGKQEEGESPEEALIRECIEELGIIIEPANLFYTLEYDYPDILVRLIIFNVYKYKGEIKALEHENLKFISPKEIKNYSFCPADKEVLELLEKINLK